MTDPREAQPRSWIARERTGVRPHVAVWPLATVLVGGAFLLLMVLGTREGPLAAEMVRLEGLVGWLQMLMPGRILSAASAAVVVASTIAIGWRLFHSVVAGLLAALLLLLDPAFLAHGHLATGTMFLLALQVAGLALFLAPNPWHWGAAVLLLLGSMVLPWTLLWSLPMLLLVLLRGHIYAAPKHLLVAAVQTVILPLGGAVAGLLWGWSSCTGARLLALGLGDVQRLSGSTFAMHNPVPWFAGAGVLVAFGVAALMHIVAHFRMQRLPGRIMFRMPEPLQRSQGRFLWLLGLAFLAPSPATWSVLFPLALGAGATDLGKDARGFGILLGVLLVVFTGAYLVRLWPLITGSLPPADAFPLAHVVPWAQVTDCRVP